MGKEELGGRRKQRHNTAKKYRKEKKKWPEGIGKAVRRKDEPD